MAEFFSFDVNEPSDTSVGKGWYNPDIGQVYLRIGGSWIPFAGGEPAPLREGTIFIRGADKSPYVKRHTLKITDNLTSKVDVCSFIYEDRDGDFKPQQGDQVVVFDGTEKIFGGLILSAPQTQIGIQKYAYAVKATDYSQYLKKFRAVQSYTQQTAGYIIKDLIDTYIKEITYDNVLEGPTIEYISWNYESVYGCIEELAKLTGYDWYVDYNLDLHFFSTETNIAPYTITDDATTGQYNGLTIKIDKSQLRNRVYVRGGYYLSNLYTQEIEADGEQLDFILAYTPYSPITVYVNGVAKTLGIDNVDETGYDFLVNRTEKNVKNLDHALLGAGDVFKATYKYKVPILVRLDDGDSQAAVRAIEGGEGIYEGPIIVDETIETIEAARDRASAELRQYANPLVTGSFETEDQGYRSGQLLTLNILSRGFSGDYLIQSVTKSSLGIGRFTYSVEFATRLKGLTEFLIELLKRGRKIIERDDEVLDELLQKSDTIIFTPSAATFDEDTPPYEYGPGGTPQGVYGESQYA